MVQIWGITDRGAVREQNQDAYAARLLEDGAALAVVCDGMGGAKAGNIASGMAVDLFLSTFLRSEKEAGVPERMTAAAERANREIFERASTDRDCLGMGTTLVAAWADASQAILLNEGDSRAYHITPDGIVRVTRDHSLVQDLVERGEITPEQARTHPQKNLITRALGSEPDLRTDEFDLTWSEGDFLLLCSDGLSNLVTDQELLYEVIHGGAPETCCRRLLDIALRRGAPDNVTAVLLQNG